ncbi:mycofactocin-coupled SDR family oxidoreductase [Amycolatopsis sp. GM8]|uniref:mycofactocin-coupled SDR family oxidoreductase n=1 Tax=Amycolatopsis sp. GM8 TaxID=2896530 RepID=UPI001F3D86D6|nr:mycofactocin-coupled SDR family oxidoreductase [Amycolatopsis sp. GM8]
MGRVAGKIAFITGAARGQGRAHAVRLAEEGADIIAMDICGPIDTSVAKPATPEDLAETARLVEKAGGRVHTFQGDVRDFAALKAGLDEGVAALGGLDIVVGNAGMWSYGLVEEIPLEAWNTILDINLTGVWHTVRAAVPHLKAGGKGGSIILTSSVAGLKAYAHCSPYVAAKHGVVGLMRTAAVELGEFSIRVNTVNPSNVRTDLIHNETTYHLFAPDLENPTWEQVAPRFQGMHLLPSPDVLPEDVANAVLFLASDESKRTTGLTLTVDCGNYTK